MSDLDELREAMGEPSSVRAAMEANRPDWKLAARGWAGPASFGRPQDEHDPIAAIRDLQGKVEQVEELRELQADLPSCVRPWREDPYVLGHVTLPANPELVPVTGMSSAHVVTQGALGVDPMSWRALIRAERAIVRGSPKAAELVERALRYWGRRLVMRLEDGTIGYGMARTDDCFRCGVATALQIHVDEVPDGRVYRRIRDGDDPETINRETWRDFVRWLNGRGLELYLHDELRPTHRERWVGMLMPPPLDPSDPVKRERGPFDGHCVVCSYDQIIFDPTTTVPSMPGYRPKAWQLSEVVAGLVFDPIDGEE